jgi:hypothetical protein
MEVVEIINTEVYDKDEAYVPESDDYIEPDVYLYSNQNYLSFNDNEMIEKPKECAQQLNLVEI